MSDPFVSASSGPSQDSSNVERDRYDRYLLPDPEKESKKKIPWTRATTFSKSIADTFGLTQWEKRLVAKGVASRDDLYALAAATPIEDKDTFNKIANEAKDAAGGSAAASLGTALHSFTEAVDKGEDPVIPDRWKKDIAAYRKMVHDSGLEFPKWGIERRVVVSQYNVAGTFDRIARLTKPITVEFHDRKVELQTGDWVIYDVKTGKDLRYSYSEISIQLALYSRADGMWNGSTEEYEELPPVRQDVALVAHLPVGKGKSSLVGIDIQTGWEATELCAKVREWRRRKDLGTERVEFQFQSWGDRIQAAQNREELSAIWKEAVSVGEWNSQLEKMGKARMSEW